MGKYSLQIEVEPRYIQQFNEQGQKLCFAFGVASDHNRGPDFNVVAISSDVSYNHSISWSEKYRIAGSKDSFRGGVQLRASTEMTDISPGQNYSIPEDWTNGSVKDDPSVPGGSFTCTNYTREGAAVLYKIINGQPRAIYSNRSAPMRQGTETLVPKLSVAVWFAGYGAQAGNMVSEFNGDHMVVDLSNKSSAALKYDGRRSTV